MGAIAFRRAGIAPKGRSYGDRRMPDRRNRGAAKKKAGPKARDKGERTLEMEADPCNRGGGGQYAMFCDQYASICCTRASGSGT